MLAYFDFGDPDIPGLQIHVHVVNMRCVVVLRPR